MWLFKVGEGNAQKCNIITIGTTVHDCHFLIRRVNIQLKILFHLKNKEFISIHPSIHLIYPLPPALRVLGSARVYSSCH